MNRGIVHFDGGSRGNPGPAAGAFVLDLGDGFPLYGWDFIGEATNNVAEYRGLILGIKEAARRGVQCLSIYGDSLLVISHITCAWQCKSEQLIPLKNEARKILKDNFINWEAHHIRRANNKKADELVNQCLDLAQEA